MRAEIEKFSARVGRDPMLVQGAGGNISWKTDDTMFIKASGTWLSDAENENIFVPLALQPLRSAVDQGRYDAPIAALDGDLRPSIETILHAVFSQKIVVHTHAIEALARLVRHHAEAEIRAALTGIQHFVVAYQKPGPALGAAVHMTLDGARGLCAVLLANHGLIIAGDKLAEVDAFQNEVLKRLAVAPAHHERPTPRVSCPQGFVQFHHPHAMTVLADEWAMIRENWALYPDHVVFLGARPLLFESVQELSEAIGESKEHYAYALVRDTGVFLAVDASRNQAAMLGCYFDVMARQRCEGRLATLSDAQVAELLNWDAEKYRLRLGR